MKRDFDLIRKIVLAVEDAENGMAPEAIAIEGCLPDAKAFISLLPEV